MLDKRIIAPILLMALLGTAMAVAADAENRAGPGLSLTFSGESVEFELEKIGNHSLVNVDIGDGERHRFIVDTGAPINVIDEKLAAEHRFELIGETMVGAPGGNQVPGKVVRIPELRVGGAVVKDGEFVLIALDQMSLGLMQGILGMGLFKDYLLTIDQGQGKIEVSRASLSPGDESVIAYDGSNNQIEIEIDIAGQSVATNIDTGAPGYFTLPIELKDSLPLSDVPVSAGTAVLVGGSRNVERATLNGVIAFAGLHYENPAVAFMNPSTGRGNIGNGVLGSLRITLDQGNNLVSFRRSAPQSVVQQPTGEPQVIRQRVAAPASDRRRLGVRLMGDPVSGQWIVGGADPDSIGERVGFQAGDKIVSINGRRSEEFDVASLGSLLGSVTPLEFVVERNGSTEVIKVP